VPFNIPALTGNEEKYVRDAIRNRKFSGDGPYVKKCESWLESNLGCKRALLTPSGTHALEMAALLCDIEPGDEVIMPSYTFSSTANAFALRGARIVFVDIRPDTMNMDEKLIEAAITPKTKAIVPVHYAGVACEMDAILSIAEKRNLPVVEDAAQAIMSSYRGKYLGTIGQLGCLSFHETKNIQCGEGGALLINDERFIERAEIIREKGTDRSRFYRGEIDRYTWVDIGSSYLMSELNAAFTFSQLEISEEITENRLKSWDTYYTHLKPLAEKGLIELPAIPSDCINNGHIFYIKSKDIEERTELSNYLLKNGISTFFHYIPLHGAKAGRKLCRFHNEDLFTTEESKRILRLPIYYKIEIAKIETTVKRIKDFYNRLY